MKRAAAVVLLLALAGCGGDGTAPPASGPTAPPAASATASPTPVAGPATFLEQAHAMDFGKKDFASAPDDALLELGNGTCEGFDSGLSYGRVVQGYTSSDAGATPEQAETFVRAAVANLCPEHERELP